MNYHEPNQQLKYFIYARKSTESEDKQLASIESQITELEQIVNRLGLNVVEIFTETKSAKTPHQRPVFNEMIERIIKGEANAILCWKLDRLARNPLDGAQISWLLQTNVIKNIKTYTGDFYPSDNVVLMSIEFGISNQFVKDLSINSKRGLKSKAERGWYPVKPPLGYLPAPNKRKGEKEIITDLERFDLVKRMFDMMLSGNYKPPQILDIATNQWGLRSTKDKKIARSTIYHMFKNTFYYGWYEYPKGSGNWMKGKHKPMISQTDHEKILHLLGEKATGRPKTLEFPYRGSIFCGHCGCMVTAEIKRKKLKDNSIKIYTYYHCTHKKPDIPCKQPSVEEKNLEKQIQELLSSIQLPNDFVNWALQVLKRKNQEEAETHNKILNKHRVNYDKCVSRIKRLIDMRADGELTEDEFQERKSELQKEKLHLQTLINDSDARVDNWVKIAEQLYQFAHTAKDKFKNGSIEQKKHILNQLGSNLVLKDKKLLIQGNKMIEHLQKVVFEQQRVLSTFEPLYTALTVTKRTPDKGALIKYRRSDSNRHGREPTGF